MRKLRVIITVLGALGALYGAVLPSPAGAAGLPAPVADCSTHGKLTQHYSASQLRAAIAAMPVDVKEYTNCPTVLNHALLADLGQLGGGSGGSGGSFLPGWVIAVLVVLLLAGAGTGAMAMRNRRRGP